MGFTARTHEKREIQKRREQEGLTHHKEQSKPRFHGEKLPNKTFILLYTPGLGEKLFNSY